jgi:WD40 repeat protein
LASASADKTIKIWNTETGKVIHTLYGHNNWITDLKILPDDTLASGSLNKTIKIWQVIKN